MVSLVDSTQEEYCNYCTISRLVSHVDMPRSRPGLTPGGRGVAGRGLAPTTRRWWVDVHFPAASVKLPRSVIRMFVLTYQPCRASRKPASLPAGSILGVSTTPISALRVCVHPSIMFTHSTSSSHVSLTSNRCTRPIRTFTLYFSTGRRISGSLTRLPRYAQVVIIFK